MKARKDLEKEKNINQASPVKIARMYKHQNESHMHIISLNGFRVSWDQMLEVTFPYVLHFLQIKLLFNQYFCIFFHYWQVTFSTSASSIISQYVSKLVRTRLLFHQYFLPFFSLLIRFFTQLLFHPCVVPS